MDDALDVTAQSVQNASCDAITHFKIRTTKGRHKD